MTPKTLHLSPPKYRRDIDGLRAVAVLAVVAFHAFPDKMKGGFIGVDIFFVISGYLISTIIFESLDKGTFSFSEFYARRIKRIFPALILVLVACFTFGWFVLLANEYKQLGKHIAAGAGFISNIIFWRDAGYFDNAADTKPLLHLWSLGIEEQFYIVWPFLLWVSWKRKFNLLIITILVATLSFILNIQGVKNNAVATFYSPLTRFWELLIGSLLAWITIYKKDAYQNVELKMEGWLDSIICLKKVEGDGKILSNVLSVLGFFLLALGFLRINKDLSFPGKWALIPVLGAVLIITAGSKAWINRAILSNRVAVWFGLISFPLYLWHWPLLSFARIVECEVPSRNIRIAAVVISIALAWLTYKLVEIPLRFGKQGKVNVSVLVVLMVIVGYVGCNTYERNGLSFRFPKMVQELTNFQYNYQQEYRVGTCFLRPEQTYKDFNGCHTKAIEDKKTVLLWGDSHAAHLYPGIVKRYGLELNVVQYTASSCPPILNFDNPSRPNCLKINDFILGYIKQNSVDIVVLSAVWTHYDLSKLETTINILNKYGIKNVYFVGPVPQWIDGLPKQLLNHHNKNFPHIIPIRMTTGLNPNFINLDADLRRRIERIGAIYISPKDILCDDNGCVTKTTDTSDSITAWDDSHLTNSGSVFLVSKFLNF